VLRTLIAERGSTLREVATRAQAWCDPASVYRVLNGRTRNPQVATLAAICRALDVRPQEVFERAGLWSATAGPKDARHAELRALWVRLGCLPDAERMRVIEVVRALLGAHRAQQEAARRTP
jgi:transcriptional regulator with XRE-family HTH domain